MRTFYFSLSLLLLFLAHMAKAQLEIGATIRPRTEYRHGFKKLIKTGETAAFFTEQRTRVQLDYKAEKYKVGISFQDVRIWGETGQINKSDGLTSFHEAFAEYFFTKKFSIKAGRQELSYDDDRILGNLDWAAQARSHDAFLLKYADSSWAVHAGFAFNQNSFPVEPAKLVGDFYSSPAFGVPGGGLPNPKTLYFLWFGKSFGKFKFSILAMNTGWQFAADSSMNNLFTGGVNPEFKISPKFTVNGSFYYQSGEDRANKGTDAWMASLNFIFIGIKNTGITLGGDYLSGTEKNETRNTSFEPLFGTNHKFYGYMDYFYVGNPHAQSGKTIGLIDGYLKAKIKLSSKAILMADLHQFLSPVTITETASANTVSTNLGTEADIVFNYTLSPGAAITAGYSQMFATETMEIIKGGTIDKVNNWGWMMLTIKPTLFKQ